MKYKNDTVNLFIPCSMDMFAPTIPISVIKVLEHLGQSCFYNEESTCCGRKFFMEGAEEEAIYLSNKLMTEFSNKLPLIIPSTACSGYIKTHFKTLFENISVPAELEFFVNNVYDLCDYIVNVKHVTCVDNTFNHRVFYFKSCAARNMYNLGNEPEILLKNTKGLDLLTDPDMIDCCSANGQFALQNPEVSDIMLSSLIDKIYRQGAQYVTSTDIHCLQYIDAYIQSEEIGIEVIHIADILASKE
ncbi:MAG: (Fe-S)-binding protein [Bacteroidales bacterium]|jgi:L-lactate dehydrogenase complex protein LldE|nr:(Fe-S)-binding protein [Bacteroidales bacterium]